MPGTVRSTQDERVEYDDVHHGEERGETASYLAAIRRLSFGEFKVTIDARHRARRFFSRGNQFIYGLLNASLLMLGQRFFR